MAATLLKEKIGWKEISAQNSNIWKCCVAEFLGTLFVNFFGCASVINVIDPVQPPDFVTVALTFGFTVFIVIQTIGHVSGGHINPAVTAGYAITGKMSVAKAVLYIVSQCAGSISGSAVLKAVTPEEVQGSLGMTFVHQRLLPSQGFGMELMLGFALVLVVFAVCDEHRHESHRVLGPLAIGIMVTIGHFAAVDYTGSSMNPARSFGSALIANNFQDIWVYLIAPVFGGMAAALVYVNVFGGGHHAHLATATHHEDDEVFSVATGTAAAAAAAATDDKEMKRFDDAKSAKIESLQMA